MNEKEIRKNAESTARKIIDVFYVVSMVGCVIAIVVGIICILNSLMEGVIVLVGSVFCLLSVVLLRALCDVFLNISHKIDTQHDVLEELKKISSLLGENKTDEPKGVMATKEKLSMLLQIEDENEESLTLQNDFVVQNTPKIDNETEKDVLEEIMQERYVAARMKLMRNGLSQDEAERYIENIKSYLEQQG